MPENAYLLTAQCLDCIEKSFFDSTMFNVLQSILLTLVAIIIPTVFSWYWSEIKDVVEFLDNKYPNLDIYRDESSFNVMSDEVSRRLWYLPTCLAYHIFNWAIMKCYGSMLFPCMKEEFLKDHKSIRKSRLQLKESWNNDN